MTNELTRGWLEARLYIRAFYVIDCCDHRYTYGWETHVRSGRARKDGTARGQWAMMTGQTARGGGCGFGYMDSGVHERSAVASTALPLNVSIARRQGHTFTPYHIARIRHEPQSSLTHREKALVCHRPRAPMSQGPNEGVSEHGECHGTGRMSCATRKAKGRVFRGVSCVAVGQSTVTLCVIYLWPRTRYASIYMRVRCSDVHTLHYTVLHYTSQLK